jgi:hypothetical protein
MANTYPTSLNTHKKDWANDTPVTDTHPEEHNDVAAAVEALEAKVGVNGSAVTTSHDYKLSQITGSDKAARQSSISNIDNTSDATKNAAVATLTNKTIDADNNTIVDLTVTNFKASAIVTEAEGIDANDNDTTIPTSAAVKKFVEDSTAGGTNFPGTSAFSGTAPTSYTDLNLSSIVGTAQRMVMLRVLNSTSTNCNYMFRPNGTSYTQRDANLLGSVSRTGQHDAAGDSGFVIVKTDANGVIEWMASAANSCTIYVESYW